jgi:hypothetical protein
MNVHNWSQSKPAVSLVIHRYTTNVIALREVRACTQMWPLSFNLNEVLVVSRTSDVSCVHYFVYTNAKQKTYVLVVCINSKLTFLSGTIVMCVALLLVVFW